MYRVAYFVEIFSHLLICSLIWFDASFYLFFEDHKGGLECVQKANSLLVVVSLYIDVDDWRMTDIVAPGRQCGMEPSVGYSILIVEAIPK